MWIEGDIGFDDLEESGGRAGVNMPVSEIASRFASTASIRDRGGYITDLISGEDINSSSRWSAAARRCGTSRRTRRCA